MKLTYRRLAKQYHADQNNEAVSAEKFILIHTTYEAILLHLEKQNRGFYEKVTQPLKTTDRVRSARWRAHEFARRHYEEYLNSDEFEEDQNFLSVSRFFGLLFIVLVTVFGPFLLHHLVGDWSFLGAYIAIYLCSLHITYYFFIDVPKIEWQRILHGMKDYIRQSIVLHLLFMLGAISWLVSLLYHF